MSPLDKTGLAASDPKPIKTNKEDHMNITLLGATGKTGTELLAQALAAGNKVTVVARTPSKIAIENSNLRIVQGDATDSKALADALTGTEVLISALGSMKNAALITDSTKAILAAAKTNGSKRVIVMSSFAVNRDQLKAAAKLITGLVMRKVVADKSAGEAELRGSGLDWTIVHATTLTNDAKGNKVRVVPTTEKLGMQNKISRADVAAWILDEAKEANYVGKDVTISR